MNKRKICAWLFLLSFLVVFGSCQGDSSDDGEQQVAFMTLPQKSQLFVSDHFADQEIMQVYQRKGGYRVVLLDYILIYNTSGDWTFLESRYQNALPVTVKAVVPRLISAYVLQYYTGYDMRSVQRTDDGYTVQLNSDEAPLLYFDHEGLYMGYEGDGTAESLEFNGLPAVAQQFFLLHYPVSEVSEVEKGATAYVVVLNNLTRLEFDLTGAWIQIDGVGNVLPSSVMNLLPEAALLYLAGEYPTSSVRVIERRQNVFHVTLRNRIDLLFDRQGNAVTATGGGTTASASRTSWELLPDKVKDFIEAHFPTVPLTYAERDSYGYSLVMSDGTTVAFDTDEAMKEVVAVQAEGIPESVVLADILAYVNSHYPGQAIAAYTTVLNGGFRVVLAGYPGQELYFDSQGQPLPSIFD